MAYKLNPTTGLLDLVGSSGGGSTPEVDPLSLHLDQTTPQTVINGIPTFDAGIKLTAGVDIRPSVNSTTAINIAQADGTDFVIFDTTNKMMGLGIAPDITQCSKLSISGTPVATKSICRFYNANMATTQSTADWDSNDNGGMVYRFFRNGAYAGGVGLGGSGSFFNTAASVHYWYTGAVGTPSATWLGKWTSTGFSVGVPIGDTGGGVIHIHPTTGSATPWIHITDATTTTTAANGARIGLDSAHCLEISHQNNYAITFDTNNVERMRLLASGDITLGSGVAGYDQVLTFDGESNDGVITWLEDEDYFRFSDKVIIGTASVDSSGSMLQVAGQETISFRQEDGNLATGTPHLRLKNEASCQTLLVFDFAGVIMGGVRGDYDGNFNWHSSGSQGHQFYDSIDNSAPAAGISHTGLSIGGGAGQVSTHTLDVNGDASVTTNLMVGTAVWDSISRLQVYLATATAGQGIPFTTFSNQDGYQQTSEIWDYNDYGYGSWGAFTMYGGNASGDTFRAGEINFKNRNLVGDQKVFSMICEPLSGNSGKLVFYTPFTLAMSVCPGYVAFGTSNADDGSTAVAQVKGALSLSGALAFYDGGMYFTRFSSSGAMSGDVAYTLPATLGAAGTVLTDAAGDGVLSWAAGGGGGGNIHTSVPPASATATGTTGTITWDSDYIYVCIATDTWKRVAITTWGGGSGSAILQENNDFLLQENNDKILQEA